MVSFTPSEALTRTQDDIRKQITHTVTQSHGVSEKSIKLVSFYLKKNSTFFTNLILNVTPLIDLYQC